LQKFAESADSKEETIMAEIRPIRESALRQKQDLNIDALRSRGGPQAKFCAYNQTTQRFISNDVEVADASARGLGDLLSSLSPGSGAAVWIIPIQTPSATSLRFPVDLLYLSEDCCVLEAVNSFPIGRVSSSIAKAESVLVLPAHSVLLSGIETGDRLTLCGPDEMECLLLQLHASSIEIGIQPPTIRNDVFAIERDEIAIETTQSLWDGTFGPSALMEQSHEDIVPSGEIVAEPALAPCNPEDPGKSPHTVQSAPGHRKTESKKKWWQKLFPDEPEEDDRKAPRLALPGLVAYFFTGGAPVAHEVINISTSGLYVRTSERWYKGTVVRITLTDEREPTSERSITLHGMAARLTAEGVALQYIVEPEHERQRIKASALEHLPGGTSATQIEEFILRFKSRS
jgi:uncharacterized protein